VDNSGNNKNLKVIEIPAEGEVKSVNWRGSEEELAKNLHINEIEEKSETLANTIDPVADVLEKIIHNLDHGAEVIMWDSNSNKKEDCVGSIRHQKMVGLDPRDGI
jgi:hypothetical protein